MAIDTVALGALVGGTFLAAAALTVVGIRNAAHLGFIALPTRIHDHQRPTPLLGGAAMAMACFPVLLFAAASNPPWRYFLLGWTSLLLLGLAKDWNRWPPSIATQLAVQASAGLALSAGGLAVPLGLPPAFETALTILFVVAIVNAVNFLDVRDGLAAGSMAITFAGLGVLAALRGSEGDALVALALCAAAGGFLLYNRPPARIFMGDSGSFSLGFAAAALALRQWQAGSSGAAGALLPLLLPLSELFATVLIRLVTRRSPIKGDGRHVSTLLTRRGVSLGVLLIGAWTIAGASAAVGVFITLRANG